MRIKCISSDRSMILHVLEREVGKRAEYCGSPLFSYRVGEIVFLRSGWIEQTGDSGLAKGVFDVLGSLGLCEYPSQDIPLQERDIGYPMEGHNACSLLNLLRMIHARQRLLNRALNVCGSFFVGKKLMSDVDAHPPETVAEFLQQLYGREEEYRGIQFSLSNMVFTGFRKGREEECEIFRQLTDRMVEAARTRSWIKAYTHDSRNRKYIFRTWLNSIGMTGPEYEEARRVMLSRLPGHSDRK